MSAGERTVEERSAANEADMFVSGAAGDKQLREERLNHQVTSTRLQMNDRNISVN